MDDRITFTPARWTFAFQVSLAQQLQPTSSSSTRTIVVLYQDQEEQPSNSSAYLVVQARWSVVRTPTCVSVNHDPASQTVRARHGDTARAVSGRARRPLPSAAAARVPARRAPVPLPPVHTRPARPVGAGAASPLLAHVSTEPDRQRVGRRPPGRQRRPQRPAPAAAPPLCQKRSGPRRAAPRLARAPAFRLPTALKRRGTSPPAPPPLGEAHQILARSLLPSRAARTHATQRGS